MLFSERVLDYRRNNLDLIRFIAAASVILSHAFPLVIGKGTIEPLQEFTNGQVALGGVAVAIFFIVSGFLIIQSFERSENLIAYFTARFLRIFPALIVCVLLTMFVLGPIMTKLSLSAYFSNFETYNYAVAMTTLNFLSPNLPGVFEDNIFGTAVNGSLWTLKYEFICYIGVAFFGIIGLLKKRISLIVFLLLAVLTYIVQNPYLNDLFRLSMFFYSGMLFYLYKDKIRLNWKLALLSVLFLLLSANLGFFNLALAVFGTYLVFYLGYFKVTYENFAKNTDFSYGIYIYAWPIQQSLVAINPTMHVWENFIYTLFLAMFISYFSWRLFEKPALKLKKFKLKKLISLRVLINTKVN